MREFEMIKRDFSTIVDYKEEYEIDFHIPGAQDSANYDAEEAVIRFTKRDMEAWFQPAVENIAALVKDQVDKAEREYSDGIIKTVVFVGGFAESRYLNEKVREWCEANGGIRLLCPVNPQAAVVKGAALRGLRGTKPTRTRCRRHYGFSSGKTFEYGKDPESYAYISKWYGKKYCRHRVNWLVEKGAYIDESTSISHNIEYTATSTIQQYSLNLYSYENDHPARFETDSNVSSVGLIGFNSSQIPAGKWATKKRDGKTIKKVDVTVKVKLAAKEGALLFEIMVDSTLIAAAEVECDME